MNAMNNGLTASDISAIVGNNRDGMFGDNGGFWWIFVLFLFVFGGWGNGGYGNGGVNDNYILTTDFAQMERKLDGIANGISSLGYDQLNQMNGINQNIQQNGYETRLSTQNLGSQMANYFCNTGHQISDMNYNITNQANLLGRQIEKGFSDTNYNMSTNTCQTLQAIDKVGDRVIDYLSNKENQNLRDENFALRLSASQQAQNNYLVNQIRPCPIPAYPVANPFYTTTNGCGCA